MSMTSQPLVLVTGGSGFIGVHCILVLLNDSSYRVRTTIRNSAKKEFVKAQLKYGGVSPEAINAIDFAVVDLNKDDDWDAAVAGCTYVLHVASPFPPGEPKHEDELIKPARDGTLRVLRAAKKAGVKRVVVTSSYAAVGHGHEHETRALTEADWSVVDTKLAAYPKSKTLAERAAWDFIEKEGGEMELAVVNPAGVYGPLLGKEHHSLSVEVIVRLMNGAIPGLPDIAFGVVDVRDVADLHLRAMTDPKAKGERFLALARPQAMTVAEMAQTLKQRLGPKARRVPTRSIPHFVMRLIGLFDPAVRLVVPMLGNRPSASNQKAKDVLGWQPRSCEDAIVATAESMEQLGMLKA